VRSPSLPIEGEFDGSIVRLTTVGRRGSRGRHGRLAARRLAGAAATGALVIIAGLLAGVYWSLALTFGWDAAALVFLIWTVTRIAPKTATETEAHAQVEDQSRAKADAILLSACVASLVAVGLVLADANHHHGTDRGLLIALALISVGLAWATVHTVYTLRYASLYYADPVGGIDFHSDDRPDYHDLAYIAITIGMTFQVSDTDLNARAIRRTALRHALLSYVFGAIIIAISINVVAGLLGT
jgi:uncharacterized membrane protein